MASTIKVLLVYTKQSLPMKLNSRFFEALLLYKFSILIYYKNYLMYKNIYFGALGRIKNYFLISVYNLGVL